VPTPTETPLPTPPDAPVGLSASPGALDAIALSWTDNSSNEDGFAVERCVGSGCVDFAEIARLGAGATSYTDGLLLPLTTYTYRVRAFNGAGGSGYSNTAAAEPGL
jgi:hypothetical protein